MSEIICHICPHHCRLQEGQTGFCRARRNTDGKNTCVSYGKLTSLALDPIEKKPLFGFYPGSLILSVGSFGCNLACPFCQNHEISMHGEDDTRTYDLSPEELCTLALSHQESIGVAFTYNEPLISYEYVLNTARLLRAHGLKVVLVTNGNAELPVLEELVPYVDAMNIDLKGPPAFYRELGGDYETVKQCIRYCAARTHVEVTSLIVPGRNDSAEWIAQEAAWLSSLDKNMILHITRYFPRYHYTMPATEKQVLYRLKETAEQYLHHVYLGNVY